MRDMIQRILSKIACSGCAASGVVYVDTQVLRGAVNVRDMIQRILSKIACSGCAARGAVYADTQALRGAVNVRDITQNKKVCLAWQIHIFLRVSALQQVPARAWC